MIKLSASTHSQVRLHDGSTGLGSSRLLWPRYRDQEGLVEVQREGGWPLGTNQASVLTIRVRTEELAYFYLSLNHQGIFLQAACCQKGVLLEQVPERKTLMELCVHMSLQSDLAGHRVLCSFGEVVNKAAPGNLHNCLSIFLPFCSRNLHLSTAPLALWCDYCNCLSISKRLVMLCYLFSRRSQITNMVAKDTMQMLTIFRHTFFGQI